MDEYADYFDNVDEEEPLISISLDESDLNSPIVSIPQDGPEIVDLYQYKKYNDGKTTGPITGRALKNNLVPGLVILDFDNKTTNSLWEKYKDKFNDFDIVVSTASGGLHVYCEQGSLKCKSNRMVKWYSGDDFDIDIMSSVEPDKQSLVVLPGSKVRKNHKDKVKKYEVVCGDFEGLVMSKADEVLSRFGIITKNDDEPTIKPVKQKELTSTKSKKNSEAIDIVFAEVLINGFKGLEIHNDGGSHPIEDEITLFTLFPAINALPDKVVDKAYDVIYNEANLTPSAAANFLTARKRYANLQTSHKILIRMLKAHNPSYYEEKVVELLPKLIEIQDIDLQDSFLIDNIKAKSEDGVYTCEQDVISDLSRVLRYISCAEPMFLLKTYDKNTKRYILSYIRDDTMRTTLKRIKLWREHGNWISLEHLFSRFESKLTVRGTAFVSTDDQLFSTFHGYKYKTAENYNQELIQPFIQLIREVICDNDVVLFDYVTKWIAYIVQNPGLKTGTVLVLKGLQGIGKGTFTDTLSEMLAGYSAPNVTNIEDLTGTFNDILEDNMLIVCNEMKNAGDDRAANFNCLKSLITDETVRINQKNQPKRTAQNVANFIFVTNNSYPVKVETGDRRYVILQCSGKNKGNFSYFKTLHNLRNSVEFFESLLAYFMSINIIDFIPERIPMTKAKMELIKASMSIVEEFICEHYKSLVNGMKQDEVVYHMPMGISRRRFFLDLRDKTYESPEDPSTLYLKQECIKLYEPFTDEATH